ncbi:hypothetical protein [Microbacterium sp. MRS-1]|uniref:hypothetical protein n=1 Tax=Microbacterium sp. MRS-1 TaxID=1451261 RepID=UPI00044966AA|nr:hypothetical protein [Microbacterium sp. MRS-1]EXJ50375.1 hypothetical protein AS96_15080 [Microbacterium sp. MRS-1]
MLIEGTVGAQAEATVRRLARVLVERIPPSSALTLAVATTEAHVDTTIQQLFDLSPARRSRLGDFLIERSASAFKQTWSSRHQVLREGFGVAIEPQTVIQNLLLVVDARNAFAHGDGALTEFQTANWSRANELRRDMRRKLHATVVGRIIIITPESLEVAVRMLIAYVVALDAAVAAAVSSVS